MWKKTPVGMNLRFVHALPLAAPTVVYEHRSRLERSLQKERGEHKKTKEGESLAWVAQRWPGKPPAVPKAPPASAWLSLSGIWEQ